MTHTTSTRHALPAILLIILAGACRSPILDIAGGATGRLLVAFPAASSIAGSRAGGASSLSAYFSTIHTWTLLGDGPKGAKLSIDFTASDASSGTVSVELALGDWSLTMKGFDADGAEVLSADSSVTIESSDNNTCAFAMAWAENALVARLSFDTAIQDDTGRLTATPGNWNAENPAIAPSSSLATPSIDGSSIMRMPAATEPENVGAYVDLGAASGGGLALGLSFSVSLWVWPDSDMAAQEQILLTSQADSDQPGFTLSAMDGTVTLTCSDGSAPVNVASGSAYTANAWNYITVTIDSASSAARLYVNGAVNLSPPIPVVPGDLALRLGAKKTNSAFFAGSIDDVRIYSGALSENIVAAIYADGYFSGGRGTEASPYLVATPMDLYNVRYFSADHFRQTTDIDLSAGAWTPIPIFAGSYDGGLRTIRNLELGAGADYSGLFEAIGVGGSVRDLTLNGVTGAISMTAGALAGYMEGAAISNITLQNITLNSTQPYLGGLAGQVDNTSAPSSITTINLEGVTLNGTSYVGGLVGIIQGGEAEHVSVSGAVATDVTVTGATNLGGLFGQTGSTTTVSGSTVSGSVSSTNSSAEHLGGLVGYFFGNATNCVADVTVGPANGTTFTTASNIGGFAGQIQDPATLSDCNATGDVTGGYYEGTTSTGGFAGYITVLSDTTLTLTRCTATGDVNCAFGNRVGGFVGSFSGGSIDNSYARGAVSSNAVATAVAGFAGFVAYTEANLATSYSSGTITNGTGAFIGGTTLNQTFYGATTCYWHYLTAGTLGNPTSIADITGAVTGPKSAILNDGSDFGDWNETSSFWTFAAGSYPTLAWEHE